MQPENFHLKILPEGDFLRISSSGHFSLEASKRAFVKALEAVKLHRISKVLFDGSGLTGEPTTMERFYYGEFVASEYHKFVNAGTIIPKFAYVLKHPVLDTQRFGENVAVNRGVDIRIFDNFEEAYQWLDTKPSNIK